MGSDGSNIHGEWILLSNHIWQLQLKLSRPLVYIEFISRNYIYEHKYEQMISSWCLNCTVLDARASHELGMSVCLVSKQSLLN